MTMAGAAVRAMPLQNRVTPFGEIVAVPARGTLMGNRGGQLHDDAKRLGRRRWASRAWIACELCFRNRPRRELMAPGRYTELFFLDEVTALAAGHRPCFECRNVDAKAFGAAFAAGQGAGRRLAAKDMDALLHRERLAPCRPTVTPAGSEALPDGAMIAVGEAAYARRGGRWLRWSFAGYQADDPVEAGEWRLLTPASMMAAVAAGFVPRWHESAGQA